MTEKVSNKFRGNLGEQTKESLFNVNKKKIFMWLVENKFVKLRKRFEKTEYALLCNSGERDPCMWWRGVKNTKEMGQFLRAHERAKNAECDIRSLKEYLPYYKK